ncbi:uncharacterized protein LOC129596075 isoform X2 [Paramacrobiotus metropolitanus]|uniref:uncharacterized protein LOC129596075 isoform X2 n=1 Tax=Paramacrobiotus metropolitanus TaxID=2943436 RepID=UPI0024462923|nr:uncharacterized protein LOC129596075 isoform X2 [Paramacrobiotus metropolitanus]
MDNRANYCGANTPPPDACRLGMKAVPRCIYQPLLAEVGQMSFRNTVAVRTHSRTGAGRCNDDTDDTDEYVWWLGYIQDIDTDGEHAFIHFDSTSVAARWMHMQDVWPLPSYSFPSRGTNSENVWIYAALRDEDNGPFRFRPVLLLNILVGCSERCYTFCITTDVSDLYTVPAHRFGVEVVHENQVAFDWPPTGPSLLERRSGLRYTKHFIPFAQTNIVLSEPADKSRIIKHILHFLLHPLDFTCRFHLRVEPENGGCMFVILRCATDTQEMQRMSGTLSTILQTHVASRAHFPPVHQRTLCASENEDFHFQTGIELDVGAVLLSDLTPWLLSDILSHLDLHSQMRAKRVCVLWQLLLSHPRMKEHVSISFESCWHLQADTDNCFKTASLLSRSISPATISLTLLRVLPPHHYFVYLRYMLIAMKISLPVLVLEDHIHIQPAVAFEHDHSLLKHGAGSIMADFKETCDYILLHRWTVGSLFGRHLYHVFEEGGYFAQPYGMASHLLPAHERDCMVPLAKESHELLIDQLQITIPKLLLPWNDDEMHMTSRFMCALNDHFPPVTPDMLAKVMAVHARWRRTLHYPDDWHAIRNYLRLFSGFESDGQAKAWNEVDLRCEDVSGWSTMAIYGINELFRV